jgi:multidrug resistance efflux pump
MGIDLHLALAAKARQAADPESLAFTCCNDLRTLIAYRQAALVTLGPFGRARFFAHSGLASVETDAPYGLWLADVASHLNSQLQGLPAETPLLELTPEVLPDTLADGWAQWMPPHVWLLPLIDPTGKAQAVLFIGREEPWPEEITPDSAPFWLLRTMQVYGHAWWALSRRAWQPSQWVAGVLASPHRWRYAAALLLLLLVPVREYALAPAEVISLASQVIASPQDGVVRQMRVAPNAAVRQGEVLAELDDTTLHNRAAVARAALDTARADLLQASQRAFDRQDAKAEVGLAEGRVREREAEVAAVMAELSRLQIVAPAAGVFVYSNPDDWAGKPVQTGERLGFLADPNTLGVQAWVPVGEAINLKPGAPITLFLRVAPLSPQPARLDHASYQVTDSPDGVASYRVRASMLENTAAARVGLRGTARIGGEWTVLGYLLLRRPLAGFREWCGC